MGLLFQSGSFGAANLVLINQETTLVNRNGSRGY